MSIVDIAITAAIAYLAIGVMVAGVRHNSANPLRAIPWQWVVWWWR